MTCCPFWYWIRLRCCSVDRTSSTLMPVVSLNSLMEMVVVWERRTCRCSSVASEVAWSWPELLLLTLKDGHSYATLGACEVHLF